jgi:hypothetical protein
MTAAEEDVPSHPARERSSWIAWLLLPMLFALIVVLALVSLTLGLFWLLFSRLLPRSWRIHFLRRFGFDPSIHVSPV